MDKFGPDNSKIPSHLREAEAGVGQESRVERARRMVKSAIDTAISQEPVIDVYDTPATVTPISEAPSMRQERAAAAEAASAKESDKAARLQQARDVLADDRVTLNAEGNVVDMAKYRRVEAAREEVDASYPTVPAAEASQIEDYLPK